MAKSKTKAGNKADKTKAKSAQQSSHSHYSHNGHSADTAYYSMTPEQAVKAVGGSADGLTVEEAASRLLRHGLNELKKADRPSAFAIFISQFKQVLMILLLFAIALSLFLREYTEAIGMSVIVLLSATLGFVQEYRAEKAIEALEKLTAPSAIVLRRSDKGKNGRNETEMKIPSKEVVPGDIILLEAGDIVPADARIISAESLKIDESSLTGESVASEKNSIAIKQHIQISDQKNMIFAGTIVTYGKGIAVVVETAMKTEIGKIAESISKTEESSTPLQVKFDKMTKQIGMVITVLIVVVFILGLMKKEASITDLLIFSLSLAVAAVPSALPAIVTIGLSIGAKILAQKNMLVRNLSAAESLGSVSYICTDKTGTLTKNEMTVAKIYVNGMELDVSGTGYSPEGKISDNNDGVSGISGVSAVSVEHELEVLATIAGLCNSAQLYEEQGKWKIIGDPTEGALITLSHKAGIDEEKLEKKYEKIGELPFDSDRKRMSVICYNKKGKETIAFVKGAPELLLHLCTKVLIGGKEKKLDAEQRKSIIAKNSDMARNSLRVIGFAYKKMKGSEKHKIEAVEKELVFVGLAGMNDPPRPEVKDAIAQCKQAGIGVMMITGDHPETAEAVARQIGLFETGDIVLTGFDVEKMSEKELESKIENVRIIARALPLQKLKVIDALKKKGKLVAMTGDGVNDAPALKKADIGVSMGITGSEVSKEVSKAVLADDNFATIVNAVEEGRNIYDKIIKSTKYLLSCNIGEIITVMTAIILGMPLPLLPLQILLMNLITDGVPAMGLGLEESEKGIMQRPARPKDENPLSGKTLFVILTFGTVMAIGTLWLFRLYLPNLAKAQTIAFTTLVMFEMFAVVSCRSFRAFTKLSLWSNKWLCAGVVTSILVQIAVIYTKPLQIIFGTVPITGNDWLRIIAVSSIGFFVMEAIKFFIPEEVGEKQEKPLEDARNKNAISGSA